MIKMNPLERDVVKLYTRLGDILDLFDSKQNNNAVILGKLDKFCKDLTGQIKTHNRKQAKKGLRA